jgi:hypothetical protein
MTTRTEHLNWCKTRAFELCDQNQPAQALQSMLNDLSKHAETANHPAIELGLLMMCTGKLSTTQQARHFIEGFN